MKSEEYWNDAALRREIAVQTGTNYTGEEILKLYDEALSDIDTEMQKIKINFQKRFGISVSISDRKSTRLNSSHSQQSRMPSSA